MMRTKPSWLFITMALANPMVLAAGRVASKASDSENSSSHSEKDEKPAVKPDKKEDESPKNPVNEDYRKATDLAKAGKLKESFQVLKKLAKDETEKPRAYLLIGSLYFQKKKYKRAKRYFDETGDDVLLTKDTAFAYGATYLEYEDLSRALKGLRLALKLKAGNLNQIRYKLGVTYFKLGLYSRAERYLEQINPKTLTTGLRLERQRYLLDIRARHDEFMTSYTGQESEVRSVSSSPRAFDSMGGENDWSVAKEKEWGIRWKPGFMLHQESNQNLNKGNGRDTSEVLAHRVGTRAYAGGNSSQKSFGSLEFGAGFTGFEVKNEQSRSFEIPEATGEFLSQVNSQRSEENVFVNFQPLMNVELNSALRAEVGGNVSAYLPHSKVSQGWGQSEGFARIRGEAGDLDGGAELAIQQPFDTGAHKTTVDWLAKGDINQRLGEMNLRMNAQHWKAGDDTFREFNRERMTLVDSRYKYHVGFQSETKVAFTGSLNLGEVGLRASYEFTSRSAGVMPDRLSLSDDPETVARQANKRMFVAAIPLFDTISLSAGFGSQNLSGYTFRLRDDVTGAVLREYTSDVDQTLIQFGCAVSLVDWVKVKLTFSEGRNTYKSSTTKDASFETQNPRASENSIMHIELSKSF